MHLVIVGDIHAQAEKFWRILLEAGIADEEGEPSARLLEDDQTRLVLLGDLAHAKSREQYGILADVRRYDEYNPRHLRKAEAAQERFLYRVKEFQETLPEGRMTILMGNHDHNAAHPEQGPLRTDDVTHLEWKEAHGGELPADLREWMSSWPHELVLEDLHFAHVGPLPEHNTFDTEFYLENRRRWIYEERDWLEGTDYRLGVYGHTPVRGGVNLTSKGRVILLDTNGHGEEYCFLEIDTTPTNYRLKMRGLFFDEIVSRQAGGS
ncbi:MAG TPA: metallophosphoesterase [Trueperaceae bacterium]